MTLHTFLQMEEEKLLNEQWQASLEQDRLEAEANFYPLDKEESILLKEQG